ncbi:MAG: hypothetical protein U5M23_14735 [Marinagarivorans sp.]|nr:hypothetical protein [Marinagarivorans sp.]
MSLTNQGLGFWQSFGFAKVSIFSGGSFPSFCFSKIGSCFLLKKFRVKFAQVSKIGFMVFSQSFGKQAVSFCKVPFFWLAFFFNQVRFLKSATFFQQKFWQVLFRLFCQVHFFWQSKLFAKSVFSKGFWQVLGSGVLVSQAQFPKQSRACKKLSCV